MKRTLLVVLLAMGCASEAKHQAPEPKKVEAKEPEKKVVEKTPPKDYVSPVEEKEQKEEEAKKQRKNKKKKR